MKAYQIFLIYLLINIISSLPSKEKMIENIQKSSQFKSGKKRTFVVIGKLLLDKGFEPAFVAGILANIYYEGSIGLFESSNYKSHPEKKPQYLKYMDELHNYREKYSHKLVTEVSLNGLKNLMETLHSQNWKKGKFGLGCVQWTGERTRSLVKLYLEEANGKDRITLDEATRAEGRMIYNELTGNYKKIYNEWKSSNSKKIDSLNAAYQAGSIICRKYEVPADYKRKGDIRGKMATTFFNVMIK